VNTAIWGLIGTLVGGMISSASQLIVHKLSVTDRKVAEQRQASEQSREQRKLAYLRLLLAARQLRYAARSAPSDNREQVDALRTELATANYEIELVAAPEVAARSRQVREATADYFETAHDRADGVDESRQVARDAVAEFIQAAKLDLDIVAPKSMRRPGPAGLPAD
jgi:hypothetical protein